MTRKRKQKRAAGGKPAPQGLSSSPKGLAADNSQSPLRGDTPAPPPDEAVFNAPQVLAASVPAAESVGGSTDSLLSVSSQGSLDAASKSPLSPSQSTMSPVDAQPPPPPPLRRSSTSKSNRIKVKDELPPAPICLPVLQPAPQTSIDKLDDYIPALVASSGKGSPAPPTYPFSKSPPLQPTRSAAKSPPPTTATARSPFSSKSPTRSLSLTTSSGASQLGSTHSLASPAKPRALTPSAVLDTAFAQALSSTPDPGLTPEGKLASRAALPLALAQARSALLSATFPTSAIANVSEGFWNPVTQRIHVAHARGPMMTRVGQRGPSNSRILWPEEGMYLIARGDLKVTGVEGRDSLGVVDWGLETWYIELIGKAGKKTRNMYLVYVQLKEAGYLLARAGQGFVHASAHARSRRGTGPSPTSMTSLVNQFWPAHSRFPKSVALVLHLTTMYLTFLWRFILSPLLLHPRVRAHVPRTLSLYLVPQTLPQQPTVSPAWDYDVWKPMSVAGSKFKPSDPPAPDFRLTVVDADSLADDSNGGKGGLPVLIRDDGLRHEQLVAVVNQASVHFYLLQDKGVFDLDDMRG